MTNNFQLTPQTHGLGKLVLHGFQAGVLALALAASPLRAQSEASIAVSALPVASVVAVGGSAVAGSATVVAIPVALAVSGAVLVVKTIEVSGRATVYVLERASDGARVSIELGGNVVKSASLVVGAAVTVGVLSSGWVLSNAGELLCFIPNKTGQQLLHNERITY